MDIKIRLKFIGALIVLCIGSMFIALLLNFLNQKSLNDAQNNKYISRMLANELSKSSSELTRLARIYVVTGEPKYENQYWDVIDIRSGKKKRPDGRTISLKELMKAQGFTKTEFEKLQESEDRSNGLVETETIAMNAVKGLFKNEKGEFTLKKSPDFNLASRLMHDEKYHEYVASIMEPIEEFNSLLDTRTKQIVEKYLNRGNIFLILIGCLILLNSFLFLLFGINALKLMKDIPDKITVASQSTESVCSNVLSASERLEQSVSQQSVAVEETATAIEQISSMIQKNAQNTDISKKSSSESLNLAELGKNDIASMIHSIEEIQKSNQTLMESTQENNKKIASIVIVINQIAEKTNIINDIVFQTKLLSFNASVEAARAGQHGLGFAVVAEEIGNLARMSGAAAVEIKTLVSDSVKKVNSYVEDAKKEMTNLIEVNSKNIQYGSEMAQHCSKTFQKIAHSIEKVNAISEEIATATQEQSHGVKEISKAIHEISVATTDNSKEATYLKTSAERMLSESQSLKEVVIEISSFTNIRRPVSKTA